MPRKPPSNNDLERGERLMGVRKKLWGSREEFSKSTGIPSGTLEGWEKRGIDISCDALSVISQRGGDIVYILTGERSVSAAGANELFAESKRVMVELKERNALLEKELHDEGRRNRALQDQIVDLLDKLAGFTKRNSG